jgi:gliding motility-associated-like protein
MLDVKRLTAILFIVTSLLRAQGQIIASIVTSPTLYCSNTLISFTSVTNVPAVSYTWGVVPGAGVTLLPDLHSPTITLSFASAATHSVYLTVVADDGTSYTALQVVRVSRRANASFNASLSNSGHPTDLTLINYSTGSTSNYWIFNNDTNTKHTTYNTSKTYDASGNYSVTLIAFGSKGCNDTASYSFRISDSSSVILPNVFSPNEDGVNDVYKPITTGILSMVARVYNRQGVLITKWDRVNGFWDGRNINGEACSPDEYLVILEAVGFDNKNYKLKGMVTLIR